MPVLENSTYQPPFLLRWGHLQTVFPTLFRKIEDVASQRERIETPDDDFLDLDWYRQGSRRLVVLTHGLEGDSERIYIRGMVQAIRKAGWDALAWNFRGCSGEPNRKVHFYHSGATYDLDTVLRHVENQNQYDRIDLVGFSMGGNITLKYLGEMGERISPVIQRAVAFSVPCDLASASIELARMSNKVYMRRFLRSLHEKIKMKMAAQPGCLDDSGYSKLKNFKQFDDRYTAPLHGFRDAQDYWQQCSSKFYLSGIRRPALLVSAKDDPFLSVDCFPYEEARRSRFLFLEVPDNGGHVGFIDFPGDGSYWLERRAIEFLGAKEVQKDMLEAVSVEASKRVV